MALQGHPEFNADEMMAKIFPDIAELLPEGGRSEEAAAARLAAVEGADRLLAFLKAVIRA